MINQDELIKGTLDFINTYKQLPFLSGDDIEIEKENDDGEIEVKPYRSLKYINEYFGNHKKYSEYLLENKIITYDEISECTDIPAKRVEELLSGKAENVEVQERRAIHIFFNNDIYSHLGIMCKYCSDCTKKSCGQDYWVHVIYCPRYSKKKKKIFDK